MNAKLAAWVDEMARLCGPDRVEWLDGSEAEKQRLEAQAVASGGTTINIYPALIPSSGGQPVQYQTVDNSPANNATITPVTKPMYPGTTGNTHGERKDATPATKASPNETCPPSTLSAPRRAGDRWPSAG